MTRTTNLEELQAEIPWGDMPETLQDACTVTKALGIRYIWIDCLFIVQDSIVDWEQEAQKMGAFYERAYVKIAATGAETGSDSFMAARATRDLEVLCDQNAPEKGTCFLAELCTPHPQHHVENAPLNRRGWVLQELLLSCRVLHFAKDQIYWECSHHAVAQNGAVFQPRNTVDFVFPLTGLMKKLRSVHQSKRTADTDPAFLQAWLTIIEHYSACRFTDTDRLPAILGLENRLGPLTTRTYINRNWFLPGTSEIPSSLLWTTCGTAKHRQPTPARAVSWSWASIEGVVSFHNLRYKIEAQLLSVRTPSVMGNFEELLIRGSLLTVAVDLGDTDALVQGKVLQLLKKQIKSTPKGRAPRSIGHIAFDLESLLAGEVVFLYLFTDFTGYPVFMGLREVASSGEVGPARYRRVGIGSLLQGWRHAFKEMTEIILV